MKYFLAAITAFIFSTHLTSVMADSSSALLCRGLSEKDEQKWLQSTKVDIPKQIASRLHPLHAALTDKKQDASRFQQAEELVAAFDVDTWMMRLNEAQVIEASGDHKREIEFLFAFWVREKYLGLISRSAFRDEQWQLKWFGSKIPYASRHRLNQYPAEPMVTQIENYHCTPKDSDEIRAYRCGEPHLLVELQLSPRYLCQNEKEMESSRLKLILRLDTLRGPVIVDVERGSERIYKNTLRDLSRLKVRQSAVEILEALRRSTFFSNDDFNEIPGGGLLSLRDSLRSAPTRIPASQKK